jgi:hypothetical protein
VDVFEIFAELEFAGGYRAADLLKAGDDLMPLVVGQHPNL